MRKHVDVVGASFNTKETGSVCVSSVGWGFLVFDPAQGRSGANHETIDRHIGV